MKHTRDYEKQGYRITYHDGHKVGKVTVYGDNGVLSFRSVCKIKGWYFYSMETI